MKDNTVKSIQCGDAEDGACSSIRPALKALAFLGFTVGNWYAVWTLLTHRPEMNRLVFYVAAPIAVFTTFLLIAVWHNRRWVRPALRLEKILPAIYAGEKPIEALSQVRGGMSRLTPVLRQLLEQHLREGQGPHSDQK